MIIDNYLLTDEDKMEENISSILNALLPKQIETTFQLSIFTLLYDQRTDHHKNLQKRYDSILNIIKEIIKTATMIPTMIKPFVIPSIDFFASPVVFITVIW